MSGGQTQKLDKKAFNFIKARSKEEGSDVTSSSIDTSMTSSKTSETNSPGNNSQRK